MEPECLSPDGSANPGDVIRGDRSRWWRVSEAELSPRRFCTSLRELSLDRRTPRSVRKARSTLSGKRLMAIARCPGTGALIDKTLSRLQSAPVCGHGFLV